MQHHTNVLHGASGGHTALARLLEADWSRGVPDGYLAALDRLRQLRGEFEEQIAAAIDDLDILDMALADLEDDGEAGKPTTLDEMNPGDSEDSEPWLGSAGSESPTMSQTMWAAGAEDDREEENEHGGNIEDDGEPSLGAPELVLAAHQPSAGAIVGNQEEAWSIPSSPHFVTDGEADDGEGDGDCDLESDEGFLPGSGCLDGTRPPSFMDASKPNFGRLYADPAKMPARYVMVVEGHCMSPAIRDGEALVFVRDAQFFMRDLVVVYLDPAKAVTAGGHQALVKRFMGYGRCAAGDGIIVEVDYPTPTRYVIPNDRILAVHRCVGPVPENAKRHIVSEAEVALV